MKKTRWKNILRNTGGSLNRFLSIMFIVALGSGFIAGLAAASPDMYETADSYIKEYRLFDIDVKSYAGLDEQDISNILSSASIESYQPAVVYDMILSQENGSDFTSRVYGILDESGSSEINRFELLEGRLPENSDECIVESVFGKYSDEMIAPGDILTPVKSGSSSDTVGDSISEASLKVVGICRSPMCMSIEGDSSNIGSGTINLNVYVREDFFDCDHYTDLFLTVSGAGEFNTFSDSYDSLINDVSDNIRGVFDTCGSSYAATLSDDIREELLKAEDTLTDVENTLATVKELDNSTARSSELNSDIRDSFAAVESNSEIAGLLEQTEELLDCAEPSQNTLETLRNKLESQIHDGNSALNSLSSSEWMIRTRTDLTGFDSYSSNVGKVSALAKIFPVFFFIVALLVALTTMTRLIEERRLQTGTLKALGYTNGQILFEYMLFSFTASVAGCIIGLTAGFRLFPYAINSAYSMMYTVPSVVLPFRWEIAAWVAPVTILSILLAALWACWNEFRSVPAVLLRPKTPAAGKRIWLEHIGFIWKKLSFTQKITCRNLFRYKKRFIMTLIGVAGCSALLLTGFGVRDSVNQIVDKQFFEIYRYDLLFVLDTDNSSDTLSDLSRIIDNREMITSYMTAVQENGKVYSGKNKKEISLFVPSDMNLFPEFISLRNRKNQQPYVLDTDSVILTEKFCEEMGIHEGDTVTIEDSEGHQAEVKVKAITENYVYSYAYMSPDLYSSCFGTEPEYNNLLCTAAEKDNSVEICEQLLQEMLSEPSVIFARSVHSLRESFADSIKSINGVIYVLILAAGLLCIVVLYNLINVNICERRKELATLRVLGFYRKETQNYILRETNILSFLGAVCGLFAGIILHQVVVRTVEVNSVMFGRDIKPLSYVFALAISVVFTLLVDLIMKRPINRTDMVEAMKANE
ncbi:MAG: FtsX-like permease family protein [Parasporobacterium sp.]|nr:FtsX-like permease family protein [Parasporobacterium sp.]